VVCDQSAWHEYDESCKLAQIAPAPPEMGAILGARGDLGKFHLQQHLTGGVKSKAMKSG